MEESDNSISSSGTNDADSYAASEIRLSCFFSSFEGENPDPIESSHEDTGSEIIEPYSFEPIASGEYFHPTLQWNMKVNSPGLTIQTSKSFK